MIFDILRQRWLRKEIKALEKRTRDRQLQWPKSLAVIYDADQVNNVQVFKNWCTELDIPLAELTLLGFCKEPQKRDATEVVFFNKNLIKWSGGIANGAWNDVLSRSFDLQVHYYEEPPYDIMKFLALKLDSNFKVGYGFHDESTYDLAVNVTLTKHQLFISEIAKYLKILIP